MDGAMSGTRRESKRLESRSLAGVKVGQHKQRNCTTDDIPNPHHPPNTPDCPPLMSIHRDDVDDSNHDLEESVALGEFAIKPRLRLQARASMHPRLGLGPL